MIVLDGYEDKTWKFGHKLKKKQGCLELTLNRKTAVGPFKSRKADATARNTDSFMCKMEAQLPFEISIHPVP